MVEALIPHPPEYDICIVGAGPAGLTLASQLAYTGLRLCVLESGETERSPFGDSLKQVEFDCLPIKANSRERVVGGTSATWDGRSALLDACDFEPHGWPGWPICRDEMRRFVADAVQYRFPALRDFDVPRHGSWGSCQDLALKTS
jgi:choline dehydrogenase-like flavoprotein